MLKRISIILIIFIIIIGMCGRVSATNENEDVKYEVSFTPYIGTITVKLKDITLDDTHNYLFAISQSKSEKLDNLIFHKLNSAYSNKSINILLDSSIEDIKKVLKVTDEIYLYIKNETTGEIILSDYKINVKLPYAEAFKVFQENKDKLWQIKKIYGIQNLYYSTVKIVDTDLLEKYENLKKNISEDSITLNGDTEVINNLNINKLSENFNIPTNWNPLVSPSSSFTTKEPVLPYETVPHEPNLYLVWIKGKDNDSKEIYGYFLVNRLPNGGLLANVSYDPTTKTEKEVLTTITANREIQKVDGWELSEDKIKLTKKYTKNAKEIVTIKDNNDNSIDVVVNVNNIIEKEELTAEVSYDPTSQTTGTVKATIKTNKKVKAVEGWILSDDGMTLTKTYSKNVIETVHLVDIDGMTKDVEIKISNITKPTQQPSNDDKKDDTTVATGKLPQTGVSMTIVFIIISTIAIALVFYKKYSNYKDIK